jgi:ATP-dependent Clp protease ATP-binding subunit ClpB
VRHQWEKKEAQERLDILNKELIEKAEGTSLIKEEVTVKICSSSQMDRNTNYENAAGRTRKLLHLEEELHRRVVGQNEGIEAVSDAVRSRAGLQDMRKPVGTFHSLVQPALVKQNWQKHWQNTCLMMKMP